MKTHAALVLLLAAPLAGAQSTSTTVWVEPLQEPGLNVVAPQGTHAHPDGGVVSVFLTRDGGQPTIVLRRIGERGDRLWTLSIPQISSGTNWYLGPATVTTRGSTVLALGASGGGNDTRLLSFDSDGGTEWEVNLPSTVSGADFGAVKLGSATNGDILIASIMDNFVIAPFAGRAGVRRIDGVTGAELWNREQPAISSARGAFVGDRSYVVYIGLGGPTADCYDGQGNVIYSTTVPSPFTNFPIQNFIAVAPTGELAFGAWEAYVSQDTEITTIDPGGAVKWTQRQQAIWNVSDAAFTGSGDLVTIEASSVGRTATRFDGATGAQVWAHTAPAGTRNYRAIEPDGADGVVVLAFDSIASLPYADAKLEFIDAAGTTTGEERFEPSAGAYRHGADFARDARGNLWVPLLRYDLGGLDPIGGDTIKVVPFGDPSTVSCSANTANSTGSTGRMRAAGSATASIDNVTLVADRLPPQQFVLFLNSRSAGFSPNPGGSLGDLCLGGSIGRYVGPGQIRRTSPAGLASLQLDLARTPNGPGLVAAAAGETWFFQAWHRDLVGGSPVSNLTGAISLTFQ